MNFIFSGTPCRWHHVDLILNTNNVEFLSVEILKHLFLRTGDIYRSNLLLISTFDLDFTFDHLI